MKRTVLPLVLGWILTTRGAEGNPMNAATIQSQLEQAAATERHWKPGEFEIQESSEIQLPSCTFFTATHNTLPMAFPANYAVLGNGQIVSDVDPEAAAKIFAACDSRSPSSAGAWAEVLARFHPEVAPGTVLYEKDQAPTAVKRLQAGGTSFAPPSLSPGKDTFTVKFFLMNFETSVLSQVKATRRADGTLEVTKTKAV